ncbi:hypothetical protein ACQKLP_04375 [Chitinophaga sp. NPDC101104]|uniref:hypothetical protein n=1 Tax=Chitinophaga sp. NPDC101104 TaxID=3390561 RepID=UPI003D041EA9
MKKFYLFLLAPAMALFACNRNVYVPNQINVPLLKEKGEVKASVSLSDWQAAYAVTDNFAIMANGQYISRLLTVEGDGVDDDPIVDPNTRGGLIELGAGYTKALGVSKKAVFEVYGGYGYGGFRTLEESYLYKPDSVRGYDDYRLRTKFHKFFIQPSFGLSHKVVEVAVSTRFSLVNFNNVSSGSLTWDGDPNMRMDFQRLDGKLVGFMEPAATVRVGFKNIKWFWQLRASVPLRSDGVEAGPTLNNYFQPFSFNTGISVNFGNWLKD